MKIRMMAGVAVFSLVAVLSPQSQAAGTSDWLTVTQIGASTSGAEVVYLSGSVTTACANKTKVRINDANATGVGLHNLVLAALLSGRSIKVTTTDSCTSGYDNISFVDLK